MESQIRVAIIEDDPRIRQLLQLIVDGSPGFSCTQDFEDCETAIPDLQANTPDLLLLDVDLPRMSGIDFLKLLSEKLPKLNVVMLTVHEDSETVFNALCAGAVGYLVKGLPPDQLLLALKDAHQGGAPMSAVIARKVVQYFHNSQSNPLSARETEVLKLLCEGENYKTIAEKLFISSNTVKAHIKKIYAKLHVNTRAEAVAKAIQKRII